jgi:hypothetical protein
MPSFHMSTFLLQLSGCTSNVPVNADFWFLISLKCRLTISANTAHSRNASLSHPLFESFCRTGMSERLSYNRSTGFVTDRGVEGARYASEFQSSAATLRQRLLLTQASIQLQRAMILVHFHLSAANVSTTEHGVKPRNRCAIRPSPGSAIYFFQLETNRGEKSNPSRGRMRSTELRISRREQVFRNLRLSGNLQVGLQTTEHSITHLVRAPEASSGVLKTGSIFNCQRFFGGIPATAPEK